MKIKKLLSDQDKSVPVHKKVMPLRKIQKSIDVPKPNAESKKDLLIGQRSPDLKQRNQKFETVSKNTA